MITSDSKKGWEIFPEVKCLAVNQDSDVKEKGNVDVRASSTWRGRRKLGAARRRKSGPNVTEKDSKIAWSDVGVERVGG